MKLIQHDLAAQGKKDIDILYLADFHIGDPHSDYKVIRAALDRVLNDENTYCILGGDLMNCAIKSSISDSYDEALTPQQELEQCIKLFQPLAEKGKILGILGGNHEARIWKTDGIDMTRMLAMQLNLLDRYTEATLTMLIKTGLGYKKRPICYSLYCTHGSGGGRRLGSKINRLIDYANVIDVDVYFCGHTHSPLMAKLGAMRIVPQNGTVVNTEKLFVNTAAALSYGGYGEVQGYTPTSNAYPVVHLSGSEKKATATM